jgi:hypothetical protein
MVHRLYEELRTRSGTRAAMLAIQVATAGASAGGGRASGGGVSGSVSFSDWGCAVVALSTLHSPHSLPRCRGAARVKTTAGRVDAAAAAAAKPAGRVSVLEAGTSAAAAGALTSRAGSRLPGRPGAVLGGGGGAGGSARIGGAVKAPAMAAVGTAASSRSVSRRG